MTDTRWSAVRLSTRAGRVHGWCEIVDARGQPVRRADASVREPASFIVAAFGSDEASVTAKIERDKPIVERAAKAA